jgi:hypothetical protein
MPNSSKNSLVYGILVGTAGGLAEIFWIVLYGLSTGADIADVARAISATAGWILPIPALAAAPVLHGAAIHMLAAIALGVVLVFAWRGLAGYRMARVNEFVFMIGALAIIWAVNFFVVLPLLSPAFVDLHRVFVDLVPYSVSLASKILFGLAGAALLRRASGARIKATPVRLLAGLNP